MSNEPRIPKEPDVRPKSDPDNTVAWAILGGAFLFGCLIPFGIIFILFATCLGVTAFHL